MISFQNIQTIAKYERRILLRSWFFRIFAIISLFIIGVYGAGMIFDNNPFTWMMRSLPTAIIYANLFLLNIFQSVIAVFLATDFMKRDKKLNTSEVLFIRPMTNSEYILGKTWGLLSVFVLLDLLVILITTIYILISKQVAFEPVPILMYFFLVCIPTLIFIIGLSYTLMIILKNQPITFILLLGFIALVMFYLAERSSYVFDYMVFVRPMSFSELVGFNNLEQLLTHRISYFLLGVGLITFTIWRLNRLPNKKGPQVLLLGITIVLLTVSVYGLFGLTQQHKAVLDKRETMVEASATYFNRPVADMNKASITVDFGKQLSATALLELENNRDEVIDTLYFSLNPGLKVLTVSINETSVLFERDNLVLKVFNKKPFLPGTKNEVSISYEGIPDFTLAYLDNKDEDVFGYDQAMMLRIDREYGFYQNDYCLLTRENLWYPMPGVPYDPTRPAIFSQQFTKFDLTVKVPEGLLPVSQGKRTTSDSLTYSFDVRDPLPQISLTIGNYVEKGVDIGGINVKLAHIEGHDYYREYLGELSDTISDLIVEFLDDYERPLNMYYPYPEFTLVEAPVHFKSHPHSWTSTMAHSQPQMVFFPEGGFNIMQADFKSSVRRIKRDSERNKEGLTDKEIQARVFTNFAKGVFSDESSGFRFRPQQESNGNPYNIFSNYYYYVNYITSEECPVLNYAFESYLMQGEDDPRMMFMARMEGIGDNEKANLKLKEKSLKRIIAEEEDQDVVNNVLSAKGAYLLTWMEKQIADPGFDQFLLDYLYDNSYREIKYKELAQALSQRFNIELGGFIDDWYNASKLPSFGVGNYEVFEVIDNSQALFVVKTKVSNYSDVAGLVKFTFQVGSGGGRRGGFMGAGMSMPDPEERIYLIEANTSKEIQMVLSDAPRSVIFNTLLSENIPSSNMEFGLRSEKDDKMKAVEYERVVDIPVQLYTEGEIICDNTDDGFKTEDPALDNPVRQFVEKRKNNESDSEFVGQGWGPGPSTWSLNADANYFGKIEHSAMFVRSGEGNKTASWEKPLDKEAYYDVYVYLQEQRRFGPPGRGGRRDPEGSYFYTVHHADGVEEIELSLKDFENGWNLLGSFYISSGTGKVVLSDKGGADRVIADAVKWVIQR